MKVHVEELTPEEIELCTRRHELKMLLREQSKATNGGRIACTYCRCDMTNSQMHLSHIVPPSQGGQTDAENVVLSCGQCCDSKFGRTLDGWLQKLDTMRAEVCRLLNQQPRKQEQATAEAAA
ncbi:HNH endonuclease [Planctomicrobium piriforme]|uniref:HNH endonuclease n=1 Tax=Planctomicrobium piriforme TaxID=1576369 RepID=A0A1I3L3K9_9PLAN|nr:HNH endonuclease signature motif containing protein [Planctomicrobium piriforme]SFI79291.1 HNH endonuclease [Planctomicrobium piriforme]